MAGIAGLIDLTDRRPVPTVALRRMLQALAHRGPAGAGFHEAPGVGLGWCHLDAPEPAGLAPATSVGGVTVVCHARLTNGLGLQQRFAGPAGGPRNDVEVIAQLYEQQDVGLFEQVRGSFAFALWDSRRRRLVLGRDRVGCFPLYWSQRDGWLLFASEIKTLFASGFVQPEVDRLGLDHVFTFLGMPAARTCFQGVQAVLPGHYLLADQGPRVESRRYWDLDFPDWGEEEGGNVARLTDQFEATLMAAVQRRLPAGAPVASYVSGGIDCSTVVALASKARGQPLPTFTVQLDAPGYDETARALRAARASGSEPAILTSGRKQIAAGLPRLIRAVEAPVMDPSCVTLMLLAERVRASGCGLTFTGDGADDLFAGYPWFRVDRLLRLFDWLPGVKPSQLIRKLYLRVTAPHIPWSNVQRIQGLLAGHRAWLDLYGLVSLSRSRFYSPAMRGALGTHIAYEDLSLNLDGMRRWHPLNRDLYLGLKVQVPGLLLQAKGDRAAMLSGVQTQSPFLDEEVLAFSARLAPRYKLRRLRDKYLLRCVAARHLPKDIAWRPKVDFVAPFDSLYDETAPPWVAELLSEGSLRKTGYFDPVAVHSWWKEYATLRRGGTRRLSVEIGLGGVVATQLWHHTFIGGGLADLPGAEYTTAPALAGAALV